MDTPSFQRRPNQPNSRITNASEYGLFIFNKPKYAQ